METDVYNGHWRTEGQCLTYIRPEKTMFLMRTGHLSAIGFTVCLAAVVNSELFSPKHHSLHVESFHRASNRQQTNADLTFLSNKRCALTIWILFKQMLRAFSCSILGGLGCHVDRKVRRSGSIHSALVSTRSFPSLNYESRQMLHFERAAYIHSLLHTRSADWKKIYEWKRDHRLNTTKTKVRASKNVTIGLGKC